MNSTAHRINPALDIVALATEFRQNGKIRISDVLTEEFANQVFNSLTLFKVPVPHSVSAVTAFAPNPRYSITGWFTHYD